MKKIFNLLIATAVASIFLFLACSKKDDNKQPGPPPPPPPPVSTLSITRILPDTPYVDDEITIEGTGFGTDSTKIEVYWGSTDRFSILSINDTMIKAKLSPNIWFGLNNYAYLYIVKGDKEYTHTEYTYLREGLQLISVDNLDHGTSLIRPDEIIEFETGGGKYGGDDIYISCPAIGMGEKKVENPVITRDYYTKFKVDLPSDFYGSDRFEDTATAWVEVTVKEGTKKSSKQFITMLMPQTFINYMSVNSDTWSLKALQEKGKALNFHAVGRNFYNRLFIRVYNKTAGVVVGDILFKNQPGQGLFYGEINLPILVNAGSGMGTGEYRVTLLSADGEKWMGDTWFTLKD